MPRLKRAFDIVAACGLLLALLPLMAVIGLLVWRRLGRPVLFRQVRPGWRGKPFTLVKFRTMRDAVDLRGEPLPDHERLTPFGQWLRASSLDELPELWNILRGEMSLVGPRPLLTRYLERYTPEQARRHDVVPGLTGWAQVMGRNSLDWEEQLALDVWYVDHRSFALDLKILALTLLRVIQRRDIQQEGEATRREFQGTNGST